MKRLLSSSSSSAASQKIYQNRPLFPLSSLSLGLDRILARPHLRASIQQLPEVSRALEKIQESSLSSSDVVVTNDLKRAVDIFGSLAAGGEEHQATLALLAECQQRRAQYDSAVKTLQKLESCCRPEQHVNVSLAIAKALWLQGQASEAKAVCDQLLSEDDSNNAHAPPINSSLQEASARTGQAITRLMLVNTLDDVFSVRDPFRMAVKTLENTSSSTPPIFLALAQLNYGVAEAVYAQVVERENQVQVPMDAALRSWKQGLTTLKKQQQQRIPTPSKDHHQQYLLSLAVETRLLSSMAWGLLRMNEHRDSIDRASEFAGNALKLYDSEEGVEWREGFGHTLALVATCYHKSGSAVTAEGLFQSAIDHDKERQEQSSPQLKLELCDSYRRCADLCRDWERRDGDAKRLEEQAVQVQASLPATWQHKSSIFSSLWFWTPAL